MLSLNVYLKQRIVDLKELINITRRCMKKQTIVKFCCHKCGEEMPLDKTKLNCPHCEHSISWMRIRVKEHWAETHYEVLV